MVDLVQQSVYIFLQAYGEVNNTERLGEGPVFRVAGFRKTRERGMCSTSPLQPLATEVLTHSENRAGQAHIDGGPISKARAFAPSRWVASDMRRTASRYVIRLAVSGNLGRGTIELLKHPTGRTS